MDFRTKIEPLNYNFKISHRDAIVMAGSCFTENVGERLQRALFDVDINPFGISFNPESIARELQILMSGRNFEAKDLFRHNGLYNSFMHHSSFSKSSVEATLEAINGRIASAREHLKNAQALILTWGTAYVFRKVESGQIVNNCHKLPANRFNRVRLSVDEIVSIYTDAVENLLKFNPDIKIIITVSPVRHLADGLAGNCVSKSTLRLAAETLTERFQDVCLYFPSCEIVVDDLRDYRFYAADMVHTTDVATDYVYQTFLDSFCTPETKTAVSDCEKLYKRLSHRVMSDNPEVAEKFRKATEEVCRQAVAKYPYIEKLLK